MKHFKITMLILSLLWITACISTNKPVAQNGASLAAPGLVVAGADISKTYSRADLEALTATQSTFKDVTYKGVTVSVLLENAGFDLVTIKAVKAVASDGYTVNYDASQVLAKDVIVAYATANGELAEEDGAFRMVLPSAEGKLNVRMLAELQVIK